MSTPRHQRPEAPVRIMWGRIVGLLLLVAGVLGELGLLIFASVPGLIDGRDVACLVSAGVGIALLDGKR